MFLEICIDDMRSAVNAIASDKTYYSSLRFEVCSSLALGGLTPTVGFVSHLKRKFPLTPIYCMVRCKSDSFVYSEDDLEIMISDVEALRNAGADGFVFGCLTLGGDVDVNACTILKEACGSLPVTFHRAFDLCKRPYAALNQIIELGFVRVLTSGQAQSAVQGMEAIAGLLNLACGRIVIMPGAGLNPTNLPEILEIGAVEEVHASASKCFVSSATEPEVKMGSAAKENEVKLTCPEIVAKLRSILDAKMFLNDCSL